MRTPSIYDFMLLIDIMIIKNLAYLRMKERNGQLAPMEKNMLHETKHLDQFSVYYYNAECMKPYFKSDSSMELDLYAYVTERVYQQYHPEPEEVSAVVEQLLDSAEESLLSHVNYVFPCLIPTGYGDVILCFDMRKDVNPMILDRQRVGFIAFFIHNIRNGADRNEILGRIGMAVRNYLLQENCSWIDYPGISCPDIDRYIAEKSEEIYAQLVYIVNNGR